MRRLLMIIVLIVTLFLLFWLVVRPERTDNKSTNPDDPTSQSQVGIYLQ